MKKNLLGLLSMYAINGSHCPNTIWTVRPRDGYSGSTVGFRSDLERQDGALVRRLRDVDIDDETSNTGREPVVKVLQVGCGPPLPT